MSSIGFPKQVGQFNAAADTAQASQTQGAAYSNTAQMGNQILQLEGKQQAAYGASGVDPNSGSSLAVMMSTAQQGELSKRLQIYNANQKAQNLTTQANLARREGKVEAQAGWMNFGAQLLSSGMQAANTAATFGAGG